MRLTPIAVLVTIFLAACAQPADQAQNSSSSPAPSSSVMGTEVPSPSPVPSASAVVVQQATATASPLASSSPAALPAATPPPSSASPAATLAPGVSSVSVPASIATPQRVVELPPNAPPEIVDLHLDKTVVASGEMVTGTVHTSSNVASVEARIANFSIQVPKVAEGQFALSYTVPDLPFFLKRTYDMVVIARNTAGVKTQKVVPITVR